MTRLVRVGATITACLVLAACGSGGDTSTDTAPDEAPDDASSAGGAQEGDDGYLVFASHEELVAAAEAESGTLSITTSHVPAAVDELVAAFMEAYPFTDVIGQESGDADARILLELQSGAHTGDVVHLEDDEGLENYYPHLYKFDFLSMANDGVIDIPVEMINPEQPEAIASGTSLGSLSYNSDLLPEHLIPETYEDLLDEELRDSGLLWIDVGQVAPLAALSVEWGDDELIEYATRLGEQNPVWTRGAAASVTGMAAGETAVGSVNLYHPVVRVQRENDAPHVVPVLAEPVPVRLTTLLGINGETSMPATAALFLEFATGPEATAIYDEFGPVQGSVFREGSETNEITEGLDIAFGGWDLAERLPELESRILEAWDLPLAN